MNLLGISCYYHDAAACLLQDGRVVAAAEEERFSRRKHDSGFPRCAIAYVLRQGGIGAEGLDLVGFYDKPVLKFSRILESFVSVAPRGLSSWLHFGPTWLREKLWVENNVRRGLPGYDGQVLFAEHHESHAASAFYPSPFERAAILTLDGVGEWATSSFGVGEGSELAITKEIRFPHSLGLLYSALTYYLGFRVNSGEYKVMGLAPYGEPKYTRLLLDNVIDLRDDGSFRLNLDYFGYLTGLRMTSRRLDRLLGRPRRRPEAALEQFHMDVARSVQDVTEEAMLRMARYAHRESGGIPNLCLAGGVALNCVGNGRILREGPFERVWVQPAAGDAGGALGVALALWHRYLGNDRLPPGPGGDGMGGAYLGPEFGDDEIAAVLAEERAPHEVLAWDEIPDHVAALLAGGSVVGWFQGRMEYGPRALGARSILADPRDGAMQLRVNQKIKFRESFRPFAPAVLEERAAAWFELRTKSPYMVLVDQVAASQRVAATDDDDALRGFDRLRVRRSAIPAVTHVDGSARVQTVSRDTNPSFHALLEAFERRTGCPVLINTSFNVRGEPIVCTPRDALACFRGTDMDVLVLGRHVLRKSGQPPRGADERRGALALD